MHKSHRKQIYFFIARYIPLIYIEILPYSHYMVEFMSLQLLVKLPVMGDIHPFQGSSSLIFSSPGQSPGIAIALPTCISVGIGVCVGEC